MNITIIHERKRSPGSVSFGGKTVRDLLRQIDIVPEAVLVVRNKEVLTENELLNDNDELRLLSVISGG